MLAWHFLRADRKLNYKDGREAVDGEELEMLPVEASIHTVEETIDRPVLCKAGMHASTRLIDALQYAPGLVLCRVEVSGDVQVGDDKITGRKRKILWSVPESAMLDLIVRFARWCADRAARAARAAADAADAARAAAYAAAARAARAERLAQDEWLNAEVEKLRAGV